MMNLVMRNQSSSISRLAAGAIPFLATVAWPLLALADDSKKDIYDGRLEGYSHNVTVQDASGPALLWVLLVFLAAVSLGVMFKSSRRTHLD